ncbi:MAG: hypothetical protein J5509_00880 [Lachnospiraceae bacterium]|nr:hypothetical protein [Lachnospiraceae bacterium]
MKKTKHQGVFTRICAMVTAAIVIVSGLDMTTVTALAASVPSDNGEQGMTTKTVNISTTNTISGFEKLSDEIAYQTVTQGGKEDAILFPDSLKVTVTTSTLTVKTKIRKAMDELTTGTGTGDTQATEPASDPFDTTAAPMIENAPESGIESPTDASVQGETEGTSDTSAPTGTDTTFDPASDPAVSADNPSDKTSSHAETAPPTDNPATEIAPRTETDSQADLLSNNSGSTEAPADVPAQDTSTGAAIYELIDGIRNIFTPMMVQAADLAAVSDETTGGGNTITDTATGEVTETTTDTSAEIVTLSGITWKQDASLSSAPAFSSKKVGDVYVYTPVFSDEIMGTYEFDDGLTLPRITVTITEKEKPAFSQAVTVNGVEITVKADEGVFPKGATLHARRVLLGEKSRVDGAIEDVREDGVNVAISYTYDIKVRDEDGEEIEPDTSKGNVRVSFAMSEADNQNLSADVYHIGDDMNAEKLAASTTTEGGEPTVVAETDGFSYYTVEFTYGDMQYVMEGDTEVPLQDVLDYVGIAGTVTNAYGSNDELFSAENRNGTWYLVAHKAFKSREWLKVTLDGVEMDVEIVVTDDAVKTYTFKPGGVWDENGDRVSSYVYLNTNDILKFEGSEGEGGGITIKFHRAFLDEQDKGTYYSGQRTVSTLFGEKVLLDAHAGGTPGTYHFGRVITVNLNASGGTSGTTTFEASPTRAYFPDYVEIPTRPGYKFLGYYGTFDSEGTGEPEERMWYGADGKFEWATYLIGDGFTLYAHWEVLTSTVTLKPNGGSGSDFTVTATYGNNMPAIASAYLPARTGYTFAGYYDTNGTQYYTSSGASARTWDKTANTTLYARWTANTYTVTLNRNGGSGGSTGVQATYDSNMPSATMPTRNGYVFQGYYDTNAQTGGTQYYTSTGVSAGKWNKTVNTTLYARWKEIAVVSNAPAGIPGLVYTSDPLSLVTEGQVQNATWSKIQYRLGTSGTWSDDIPSQTAADSYDVYYKATSTNTDSCVDSAVSGPVSVTIGKATEPLVITPDSGQSKHYGGADPILTYTVTAGLLGSDTSSVVSGSLQRASGENVGEYEISNNNLTAANYNITVTSEVMFTITKAAAPASTAAGLSSSQMPTATNPTYTGSMQNLLSVPVNPPVGYTLQYTLDPSDDNSWSTTIPQASEGGNYTVYVRYVADDNHEPIEGTIEIPVNITVAATIGDNKYGTIAEAVVAWNTNGGTLVLQDDITTSSALNLNADVVRNLDLNGHSITNTGTGAAISVSGGSLTVNNSGSGGSIIGGGTGAGIDVSGSANLTVSSGTVTSQSGYGINSFTSGALQITGSSSVGGNGVYLGTGSKIDLLQGLTSNKPVKVTMQTPGEFTVNGNYDSSTDAGYEAVESDFASGAGGYGVSISNGQATLVEAVVYGGITVNGKPLNSSNIERLLPGITTAGGVTYTAGSPNTLTINGNYTIPEGVTIDVPAGTSIVIPSGNTLTNNGTISGAGTIQNNGSLENNGTVNTTAVVNSNGSTLTNGTDGVMSGPVTNNGGTVTNNGTMSGTVANNSGTIDNNGTLSGTTTNASGAVLNNNTGGKITGSVNNEGTFNNAGEISGSGTVSNTGSGATLTNTGIIGGSVAVNNTGDATITNNGSISTTGTVNNGTGSTITNNAGKTISSPVQNGGEFTNNGVLSGSVTNSNGGEIINSDGGTISGTVTNTGQVVNNIDGTITGNITNQNGGEIVNNNGGTISGTVTNTGTGSRVVNNSGGEITGGVNNTSGAALNNNAGGNISGNVNNTSGATVNNAEGATLSGNVNNGSGSTLNNEGVISGAGKTVTNNGTMTNDGSVTATGGINNAGGTLTNNAGKTISAPVNNSAGGAVTNNGTLAGPVSNTGDNSTISNSTTGSISGNVTNSDGGDIINGGTISGNVTSSGDGSTVVNSNAGTLSGNVNNGSGSTLNNEGVISGDGKTVTNSGTMTNDGSVTATGGVNNTGGTLTNSAGKEITGPVKNSAGGTVNNSGTLSGDVTSTGDGSRIDNGSTGQLTGNVTNGTGSTLDNDGAINGDGKTVTNSGTMTNDGTVTATVGINNTGGTLTNSNGKEIAVPVNNSNGGTLNNEGTLSGSITNTATVNNSGEISGSVTNTKSGNNAGIINNEAGGSISGGVDNQNGAVINNQTGAGITGDVDNMGALINGGGTTTGTVNTSSTGTEITAPDGHTDEVNVSPDGKITVPAGTVIESTAAAGGSSTVTLPGDPDSTDGSTNYTIPADKATQVTKNGDTTSFPAGSSINKDGTNIALNYGGSINDAGEIKVTPSPAPAPAPTPSGDSGSNNSAGNSSSAGQYDENLLRELYNTLLGNNNNTGVNTNSSSDGSSSNDSSGGTGTSADNAKAVTTETDANKTAANSAQNGNTNRSSGRNAALSNTADAGTEETASDLDGGSEGTGAFPPIPFGDDREDTYGTGSVIIEVESRKPDGTISAQTGALNGTTADILRACLTEEELDAVSNGQDVIVKLVVIPITKDVPATDKEQIDTALENIADEPLTLGCYLDLSVMKSIGGGAWEKVTKLNEELLITIDIEEELRADGRTFYVLRSHDGSVTMLFDKDTDPDTISILSGLFSTYAIAYTDNAEVSEELEKVAESNDKAGTDLITNAPSTDVTTTKTGGFPWWILILILVAAALAVGGFIIYKKRN